MPQGQLFTTTSLHTLGGVSLAVIITVQGIKHWPILRIIPIRALTLLISELLLILTSPSIPTSTAGWTVLSLNGLLVATASIGGGYVWDTVQNTVSGRGVK